MDCFEVAYSKKAKEDIHKLYEFIVFEYKAPITAFRYVQGLFDEIRKLSYSAQSYSIQTQKVFQQYGKNVRKINYKRMTIIYTVNGSVVYIQRVVASLLISDL